jgi:hypothetical protein
LNKETKQVETKQVNFDENNKQHNKLLVVYPFEIEVAKLQTISSQFKELGGDRLGLKAIKSIEGEDDPVEGQSASVGKSYISIRVGEMKCLQPGEWLNDSIIDFL